MWGERIKRVFENTGRLLLFAGGMIVKLIPGRNHSPQPISDAQDISLNPNPPAAPQKALSVILLCFPYDRWTGEAVRWMNQVAGSPIASNLEIHTLRSPSAKRNDLISLLNEHSGKYLIKLFCGHGDFNAILGPPQGDRLDVKIGDTWHGVIYDYDMISPAPGAMFAFCCRAARNFGRVFAAYKGKAFLGFDEDLPIVYDRDFLSCLEEIFTGVAQQILTEGGILPKHEAQLRDGYESAKGYYEYGAGRRHKRSFLMKLYLEEHKGAIKKFGM